MKLYKAVKRLLQEGFYHIEIKGDQISIYVDYTIHGDEFKNLHDDFSKDFHLEMTTEDEFIIITLTKIQ